MNRTPFSPYFRRPSILTVLRHIKPVGWAISAIFFAIAATAVVDAFCQALHPLAAIIIAGGFICAWYHMIYREARFDACGDLLMLSDGTFPDDPEP